MKKNGFRILACLEDTNVDLKGFALNRYLKGRITELRPLSQFLAAGRPVTHDETVDREQYDRADNRYDD